MAHDRGLAENWVNTVVADQTGPDNVHVRDLLALRPTDAELDVAAEWVRAQDAGPDFQAVLARVVAYVQDALR